MRQTEEIVSDVSIYSEANALLQALTGVFEQTISGAESERSFLRDTRNWTASSSGVVADFSPPPFSKIDGNGIAEMENGWETDFNVADLGRRCIRLAAFIAVTAIIDCRNGFKNFSQREGPEKVSQIESKKTRTKSRRKFIPISCFGHYWQRWFQFGYYGFLNFSWV